MSAADWPPRVTVNIDEALRSEEARRLRDRQLAHWCGLTPDQVEPFPRRLRLYDERTISWDLRQAREAAEREGVRDV
jgi:hypothetical protein